MEPRLGSKGHSEQPLSFFRRREVTYRKIGCAHCGKSAVVVISPAGEVIGVV